MAFGNIGQLIAGTAIEATKQNVINAITGPEPSKTAAAPPAPPQPEAIGAMILGQLQAMQRPLPEDQELLVQSHTGSEMFRVLEIFVPTIQVFVLSGVDSEQNVMRVIVPAERAQLVCKIRKVAGDAKPVRVNVRSPRPKPE